MAELKTQKTNASVEDFINTVEDEKKRADAQTLVQIFTKITGEKPAMWGTSIIGFGSYHYKSERSRQEGDWPRTGFSPRKANLSIYIMPGFGDYQDLLAKLGKHKTSVSCLYVKRLEDIDLKILEKIITKSFDEMQRQYPE